MKSLIAFLLLVFSGTFLFRPEASAQLPKLAIGQSGIWQSRDTVNCASGDSAVTYSLFVRNVGTGPFQGAILVEALYNSDTSVYVLASENVVSPLYPDDSLRFIIVDSIRAPYIGGDNILVIWPASTDPQSVETVDSGIVHLHIENCPTSVEPDFHINERFIFWPNPAKENINFRVLESKELFESVRILDCAGKLLRVSETNAEMIDLSELSGGIYLLEVRFGDGLRGTFRIIKE